MIQWTSALSVGVTDIDAQHQELFRRAERLLEGLRRGDVEEIGPLFEFLRDYAVRHFGAEEARMQAARYRGYARHKAQHDRFIADMLELAREHRERPGAFLAVKASHWLANWLQEHVSGTDAELGRFLARRSA